LYRYCRNIVSLLIYKIYCLFVKSVTIYIKKYKIRVNLNNKFRFSNLKAIKKFPNHEPEVIDSLLTLKNINLIVNIGSNIGLYCILFEKLFPHSKIIGFEPNFLFYKESLKNLKINGCKNINIINKAVGKINSSIFIDNNLIGSSYIIEKKTNNNKPNTKLITLDDYLIDTKPDLIFMDVDGFELDVLKGSKNILRYKPILIIEIHPLLLKKNKYDMADIFSFLKKYHYSAKLLRYPDKFGDHKQIHYLFYPDN
jgi:FkbM family methyltransferase